ncbi:M48 family metallopeptidase [Thalassobaculum sp.]|uniref:M48 family metallopeptidase n=1 Tax=Thalassobaculum sp. TaxID=2022740 RepID=UPI003B5AD7BC
MPDLVVGNAVIPYTLRRSPTARKARITVTPDQVEVVVPAAANDDQIARILAKKRAWIFEHHQRMAERLAGMHTIRRFTTGAKIPYRGRLARLTVGTTAERLVSISYRSGFTIDCPHQIPEEGRDAVIESELRLWMKTRLRHDVQALARPLAARLGTKPRDIRVKDQRTMWGSCGQDRVVNLNWRLVFAPRQVLEYALAHEMAHLRERHHGAAFWSVVRSLMPDYEPHKAWLEANEHLLGYRVIPVEI